MNLQRWMRQLGPGTLEIKQYRLANTQLIFDNADDGGLSTLEQMWYQVEIKPFAEAYPYITSKLIDIDKMVIFNLKV